MLPCLPNVDTTGQDIVRYVPSRWRTHVYLRRQSWLADEPRLVSQPGSLSQVTVELGTEQFEATAVRLSGEGRDRLYAKVTQVHPAAADYEKKTTRKIPVVEL